MMLSLAIFVGFKRFARSAGFALCAALRIRSGAPCLGMNVCWCAYCRLYASQSCQHTEQPTRFSAAAALCLPSASTCCSACVSLCASLCAYVCVYLCACVCACVRVFMDSASKLNFAHNNDISHIAVRVMAIGWLWSWLWLRLWLWPGIALGCLCLDFALFAIASPTFCLAYGIRMRASP